MKRVLFIVKYRGVSYEQSEPRKPNSEQKPYHLSSGLYNSARFVSKMLEMNGVDSKIVQVVDNNEIDRVVSEYKPTHVMIEALWVVPPKFEILQKLHPKVKWIIRLHSEVPFIANEGNAIEWSLEYLKFKNVLVAPNTVRMLKDMRKIVKARYGAQVARTKLLYLPNYYYSPIFKKDYYLNYEDLHVGCFGAIRPMKNQLIQAIAAIDYATKTGQRLVFHINAGRVEHGNSALKNIQALFAGLDPHRFELREHGWLDHDAFLRLVRDMDICLQVSFSETQNIATCDAVSQGIPVVVSKEIDWVSPLFHAKCTSSDDIVRKMTRALRWKRFGAWLNRKGLLAYNFDSKNVWLSHFKYCFKDI